MMLHRQHNKRTQFLCCATLLLYYSFKLLKNHVPKNIWLMPDVNYPQIIHIWHFLKLLKLRLTSWWSYAGSNRGPPACKAGALPAELWPRFTQVTCVKTSLVGLGRLELPTSPLSGVRSNQLSYKPISCIRLREDNVVTWYPSTSLLFFIKTKQSVWTLNEARSAVIVRRWSNPRFP